MKNPVWLAPLAGITTPSVRLFFKSMGAGLTHTEMISCAGLAHGSRKTFSMLRMIEGEGPLVLQLFAPDEVTLFEGARRALSRSSFDAISINMACPMPKVTKKGAGSSLLERPETAAAMVRALTPLGLPVWAKTGSHPPPPRWIPFLFRGCCWRLVLPMSVSTVERRHRSTGAGRIETPSSAPPRPSPA